MCCIKTSQQIRGNQDRRGFDRRTEQSGRCTWKESLNTHGAEWKDTTRPVEEIETEIADTDEYLDLKIHQIKKLVNSNLSSLNVNISVLNHNASSKFTSSTVNVNAQAPVQESDTRRIQDGQPPTLVDMSNSMETSQPHESSYSHAIGPHQTASNASTCSSSLRDFLNLHYLHFPAIYLCGSHFGIPLNYPCIWIQIFPRSRSSITSRPS